MIPIAIDPRLFDRKGLGEGDLLEFDGKSITPEDESVKVKAPDFHTGNLMVKVYEAGPETVKIEGSRLCYQDARLYQWRQAAERMIGIDTIPEALCVRQVIGEDWPRSHNPRIAQG